MVALTVVTLVLTGCGDDTERPAVPPTPAPAASPSAPPYTVGNTRPADADRGTTTTLLVASGSTADAQAAITDYFRKTPPQGYLSVEAVSPAGAAEWVCAGERLTTEQDMRYAIFEGTQAIENFPGEWIECRD